jgi:hypothetical protein
MLYFRDPLNTPFTRVVTVHADGPGGTQIGQTRTYGNGGDQRLIYGDGQMPTVAGQTCYLRIRSPSPNIGAVIMQMDPRPDFSDPMPGGCLWLGNGGMPIPYPDRDLGVCILSDDDGLQTGLFARPDGTVWNSVTRVGQSFVARGVNLISAAFWLADASAPFYVVRVFEDGPTGNPVGTIKRGRPARVSADPEMLVVWPPGECPLIPGRTYYIEISREGGVPFNSVYANSSDPYPHGRAYMNGNPANPTADLAGTILQETHPGSATQPTVRFVTDPVIPESQRTTNSLTIRWSTDVAAESLVEYAVTYPPYTLRQTNSTPTTTHEVHLTGLLPHTLYHFRVQSRRDGYRSAVSRDFVICTRPAAPNLLVNPGFETGSGDGPARPVVGWSTTGTLDIKAANGSWFGSLPPHSGNWLLQGAVNGSSSDGTVYQRMTSLAPGQDYTFSAWVLTAMMENNGFKYDVWNDRNRLIHVRLGIDPTGGTNPNASTVRWTPRMYSHRRYTQLAITASPLDTALTVFVRMQGTGGQWHLYAIDDCALSHEPIPLRLHSPRVTQDHFQARLIGKPHHTYLVERSPDLQTWIPAAELANPTGETAFQDALPPAPTHWFYRARRLP